MRKKCETVAETDGLRTKTAHSLVTKSQRNFEAVRSEVIQTAYYFMEETLHDEQESNVNDILKMTNATNARDLIEAG